MLIFFYCFKFDNVFTVLILSNECSAVSNAMVRVCLQGARVWVPESEDVWEGAEVQEDYTGGTLVVRTESGQVSKNTNLYHQGQHSG
jgi:hypothetical protein